MGIRSESETALGSDRDEGGQAAGGGLGMDQHRSGDRTEMSSRMEAGLGEGGDWVWSVLDSTRMGIAPGAEQHVGTGMAAG